MMLSCSGVCLQPCVKCGACGPDVWLRADNLLCIPCRFPKPKGQAMSTYVFCDTETTGLDPACSEVIDCSIVLWADGIVTPLFSRRFLPKGDCTVGAAKVNGYTREGWELLGAKPFTLLDAQEIARALVQGYKIAGFNPWFDRAMLQEEFKRVGQPWPNGTHRLLDINSMGEALAVLGEVDFATSTTIPLALGVDTRDAHTADADNRIAIDCFNALLQRAMK